MKAAEKRRSPKKSKAVATLTIAAESNAMPLDRFRKPEP
jgi:hypothetical protein